MLEAVHVVGTCVTAEINGVQDTAVALGACRVSLYQQQAQSWNVFLETGILAGSICFLSELCFHEIKKKNVVKTKPKVACVIPFHPWCLPQVLEETNFQEVLVQQMKEHVALLNHQKQKMPLWIS